MPLNIPGNNQNNYYNQDWITQNALPWAWTHNWDSTDYNVLDYTLNPGLQQFTEWSQQMAAAMYQNWYNSAPEQMKRLLAAGINPYLAANGVAGSDGGSVAPGPNSANPAANLSAMTSALAATGSTFGAVVKAVDTLSTLSHRNVETDAHARQLLANAGFNDAETDGILIDNSYKNENWLAELNIKKQNYVNMKREFDLITNQSDYIQKQMDWYDKQMQATVDEMTARSLMEEKQKFYLEQQAIAIRLENEFFQKWWSHSSDPATIALKNMFLRSMESGDDSYFNKAYDGLLQYFGDKADKENISAAGASWLSRPTNAYEATAYIGTQLSKLFPNLAKVLSQDNAVTKLQSDKEAQAEFNEAYDDAKSELYSNYRAARREYRSVKYSAASDKYKYEAKQKMLNAKREFEEFTKEKFSEMLIKQLGDPSQVPFE